MDAYGHLLAGPIRRSMIYPTVYATREQLAQCSFPVPVRRFVVIRDLRDALVSLYFSLKVSHDDQAAIVKSKRTVLQTLDKEEGLMHLLEPHESGAAIIRSWIGTEDPLLRYEDLLANDEQLLTPVLLDHCRLPISRERLVESIRANRFEKLARGRQRGQEDVAAHERKGIAGDWRNHFTDRVKDEFKRRFADILIAAGYEKDDRW
jgi:lipopolysaccharide transport system ATP-binding protein